MKQVTAVVIGAGSRGTFAYAPYALRKPHLLKFVGVADNNAHKTQRFQETYGVPKENVFNSADELFAKEKLADCALICTNDTSHFKHAIAALKKGYHILLEKPMAVTLEECIAIDEEAKKQKRMVTVCHVLRYTPFFCTIKSLLEDGAIGDVVSIVHNENVAHWHQAHSYVRGNWAKEETSSPMILAKSCHDLDILLWLLNTKCKSISSFGSLKYFKESNAPKDAPERCLDGCPHEKKCPYHVSKIYLTDNLGWPTSAICTDLSMEGRIKALKEGPFGRCVYHCDNNVVDHQVVNMMFENDVTVAFSMCAFTKECFRSIKIMGTKGEIRGHMEKNEIEVIYFEEDRIDVIQLNAGSSIVGHGGGDERIIEDFVNQVAKEDYANNKSSSEISLQSHILAFAAEKARKENKVIEL